MGFYQGWTGQQVREHAFPLVPVDGDEDNDGARTGQHGTWTTYFEKVPRKAPDAAMRVALVSAAMLSWRISNLWLHEQKLQSTKRAASKQKTKTNKLTQSAHKLM